jgi:serine O-acetyltransferase
MNLLQTLRNIKSDYIRMSQLQGIRLLPIRFLFVAITPGIMALTLYRFSHYFYIKRLRFLAWLLWLFNQYLTGVDITPSTEIGESCYIGHPAGTIISGKLGKNVTMFGGPCIGGGMGRGDVGAGEGLPVIGDNVVIAVRAMIFGPIRIGNNVTIGAGALVMQDLSPHTKLDTIGDADRTISPAVETSRAPQRLLLGHGELLEIVRSVRPAITDSELDLPLSKSSLDSLDLAIVRSAIEVRLGHTVSDELWYASNTLAEIIEIR